MPSQSQNEIMVFSATMWWSTIFGKRKVLSLYNAYTAPAALAIMMEVAYFHGWRPKRWWQWWRSSDWVDDHPCISVELVSLDKIDAENLCPFWCLHTRRTKDALPKELQECL